MLLSTFLLFAISFILGLILLLWILSFRRMKVLYSVLIIGIEFLNAYLYYELGESLMTINSLILINISKATCIIWMNERQYLIN